MAIPATGCRVWLLLPLLLICTDTSHSEPGDQAASTFRTVVNEVRVSFSVVDQNNRGVATLQASDFAVVDQDVIVRNFQSFTRSDWSKLELAILVDASESTRPHFRQELADVLEVVSQTAGVPEENLAIFSFDNQRPALVCAGDCRVSHAADRLAPARAGSLTPLFDTLVFASDFLSQHGDAQTAKVLIVLSDGDDTISRSSAADAIRAAVGSDVQVYCIAIGNSALSPKGAAVLHRVATATGGRDFPSQDGAVSALNTIFEGLHATYTVTYQLPTHAPGFHAIRILPTHNRNLQFHSRSGYYYPQRTR